MLEKIHVLGFSGSLRKASFNAGLLRTAMEQLPEDMTLEIFDLAPIPFYNEDLNVDGGPEPVKAFKARIAAADALLIATPEYNYSIPGVLKNAIDWASRPKKDTPIIGKTVAIMSASTGKLGGARAQYHLRQSFVFLNMHPVNQPEVMLASAADNIDANGKLTNEQTRALIRQLIEALVKLTNQSECKQQ